MCPGPTDSSQSSDSTSPADPHTPRYRDAYERHLPALLALDPQKLIPVNLDIPSVVTLVVGALPKIQALQPEVQDQLPKFPLVMFDRLEGVTLAMAHAHALSTATAAPSQDLAALNEQGTDLRESLYEDAEGLARHALIDPNRLRELKGPVGYRNVAFDLMALAAVLRESWPKVAGKTPIEPIDLEHAEQLAERLIAAIGAHEQSPTVVADASLVRQRAFTLFVETYDQVRRAVTYVRWNEGDAETVAPSAYSTRPPRRKKGDAEQRPASAAPPATPAEAPEPAAPTPGAPAVRPGMPGSSPFTS